MSGGDPVAEGAATSAADPVDEGAATVFTRRQVLAGSTTAAAVGAAAWLLPTGCSRAPLGTGTVVGPDDVPIELNVNGATRAVSVEPRVTLLDALRERLELVGTKKGCDRGECGACTVLIDGRRTKACLTLAIMHQDAEITTIEGIADGDSLHPLQEAFIRNDALQCGFCTPGQIMSAVGFLSERDRDPTSLSDNDIREGLSGNLCRCSCYPNIVAAVGEVARGRS